MSNTFQFIQRIFDSSANGNVSENDISGEDFGVNLKFTHDSNFLLIGANSFGDDNLGSVSLYKKTDLSYNFLDRYLGDISYGNVGILIATDNNETAIVTQGSQNFTTNFNITGNFLVFKCTNSGLVLQQTIECDISNTYINRRQVLDINNDGTIFGCGLTNTNDTSYNLVIYQRNDTDSSFNLIYNEIFDISNAYNSFSLSDDGLTFALSDTQYNTQEGRIFIYKYNSGTSTYDLNTTISNPSPGTQFNFGLEVNIRGNYLLTLSSSLTEINYIVYNLTDFTSYFDKDISGIPLFFQPAIGTPNDNKYFYTAYNTGISGEEYVSIYNEESSNLQIIQTPPDISYTYFPLLATDIANSNSNNYFFGVSYSATNDLSNYDPGFVDIYYLNIPIVPIVCPPLPPNIIKRRIFRNTIGGLSKNERFSLMARNGIFICNQP